MICCGLRGFFKPSANFSASAWFAPALHGAAYIVMLILTVCFIDGSTLFDDRILLPFYVCAMLLIGVICARWLQRGWMKSAALLVMFGFAALLFEDELDLIKDMKSIGMSLEEIRNQINTRDINYMKDMLQEQLVSIDDQIKALQNQKVKISHALDSYYNYENFPPAGAMVYEHIPTRYMLSMDIEDNIYDNEEDYYNRCMRQLGAHAAKMGIPFLEFCNVGSIISLEEFRKNRLYSFKIFTFVDPYYAEFPEVIEVPDRTYLSIYLNDLHMEEKYYEELHREIREKNLEPCGDYFCEDMVNLPFVHENRRTMLIRIQVPIKFPLTTI